MTLPLQKNGPAMWVMSSMAPSQLCTPRIETTVIAQRLNRQGHLATVRLEAQSTAPKKNTRLSQETTEGNSAKQDMLESKKVHSDDTNRTNRRNSPFYSFALKRITFQVSGAG